MITLYPHQEKFVQGLAHEFRTHRSVMGQAMTGFGKTVIAGALAQRASAKGNIVLFACHRRNLLTQTAKTFEQFGIDYGMIAAGISYDKTKLVQVASIDTLRRRLDKIRFPNLVVIDEAHMAAAVTWAKVINHYRSGGARILGLSATPTRLDGKSLGDLFDTMVKGPSVRWLMDNRYLSKYEAFAPTSPDLSGVKTRMGEFEKDKLAEAMDTPDITGDAAIHYTRHAKGLRAIAYCVTIKHSKDVCSYLNANGISAAHIDGTTPRYEQQRVIRGFADGEYSILCNVELVTTGFDLSSQVGRDVPVEAIIMLRPTQSEALHLQMIGRGLRYKERPAVILDHSGNIMDRGHGLPDEERDWTLEAVKKKKKKSDSTNFLVRQCPKCYHVHRPAPACPKCGHEYEINDRELSYQDGDLVKIDPEAARKERKQWQAKCESMEELLLLEKRLGHKPGWAHFVWAGRQAKIEKAAEKRRVAKEALAAVREATLNVGELTS